MKNLILTLIITLPLTLWGQGWEQTYVETSDLGNGGESVKETMDGGFISISIPWDGPIVRGYVLKTDSYGNEIWSKQTDTNYVYKTVHELTDGYIIGGDKIWDIGSNNYPFLMKLGPNGSLIWTTTYNPNDCHNILKTCLKTNDGGFILLTDLCGTIRLIKTDISGNLMWENELDSLRGIDIIQKSNNNYLITGTKVLTPGTSDIFLLEIDNLGNLLWIKFYNELDSNGGKSLVIENNNIIIGGGTSNISNNMILSDNIIIKTDQNGNEISRLILSHNDFDDLTTIKKTNNGFIITDKHFYTEGRLIKVDQSFNIEWEKSFTNDGLITNGGGLMDVINTSDGGFVCVGMDEGYHYLVKTNQFGNITSTFEIPLPKPDRKLEKTVNLKGQEIKPKTNQPIIEIFDDGSVEKKLIIEK